LPVLDPADLPRAACVALRTTPDAAPPVASPAERWAIPYIDQPLSFWEELHAELGPVVGEVYFPLSPELLGSGRPPQPSRYLEEFLRRSPLRGSVLLNPITLPRPVEEIAPVVTEALKRLAGDYGVASATVTNLLLARRVRDQMPGLRLTASCLADVAEPYQAIAFADVCDVLVPSSRIVRDLPALQAVRAAFRGGIRLLVNEACLPGCAYRVQHFHEMGSGFERPRSLCADVLAEQPWLRLTGSWILPQHLHLYEGVYDELKLAGRVTLRNPVDYLRTFRAYVHRQALAPNAIGGGPASVLDSIEITEEFFRFTLHCGRRCHTCRVCRDYHEIQRRPTHAERSRTK
jgi:hypothetical protein